MKQAYSEFFYLSRFLPSLYIAEERVERRGLNSAPAIPADEAHGLQKPRRPTRHRSR